MMFLDWAPLRREFRVWIAIAAITLMLAGIGVVTTPAHAVANVNFFSINSSTVVTEGNSGTVNAVFTVTLSPFSATTTSVDYATSNGTATAGSDYTATSGTLTFTNGQTSKTITVPVTGDTVGEANETFNVTLSNPQNASITNGQGTGVGTINNDDTNLSINDVTQNEGNSGTSTFAFTVTRAGNNGSSVSVDYTTVDGSATSSGTNPDYATTNGTLTFLATDTTKTINVTVNGDAFPETNETFSVVLTTPTAGASITDDTGVGQLTNDETAAPPSLTISDVAQLEGDSGTSTFAFTVTRNNNGSLTNQAISVQYATVDGTATSPADFTATSGTLTFAPTDTTQTINVSVVGDLKDEAAETFTVLLSNPTNSVISDNQGLGSILDNDPVPTLSVNDPTQIEGTGGTSNMVFTVTLSAASGKTVSVDYATAAGTATAPADFTSTSGTLTFAEGDTTKTVSVPIATDSLDEPDENLTLNLSNPTNATVADGTGSGTITDDDGSAGISISDVTVTEGNSGTTNATFTLTLSPVSGQTVSVDWATADGTAKQPGDYTQSSGTVSFAPGQTSKTITVPVVGDTVDEANETFTVNLTNPQQSVVADPQGVGTITDDDGAPSLSIGEKSVGESDGTADFTVTLAPTSGQTVTVNYATAPGTATAGTDYTSTSGTLTFAPGDTTKHITVPILTDSLDEPDETYTVTLSGATNAQIGTAVGNGTIVDDDATPGLSVNDPTAVTEGNSGTTPIDFTVSLSAASAQTVTVNYATADGTATAGSDYTSASGTLTFTPGQTSKTVTVNVTGDTNPEFNEAFFLNLTAPTNASLSDAQGIGGITNDDGPPAQISIDDQTVTEGNSGTVNATFTVSLAAAVGGTVTVHYATSDGTATQPSDYTSTSGDLTFNPGDTSKTVTVVVKGDIADEPNETFNVNLTNPSTNAVITDNQGVGTITDDDATPTLAIDDVAVTEGNTGTINATFTVTKTGTSAQNVTVHYATADGTATQPGDYTSTSGDLTFLTGDSTKTVNVVVKGDTVGEANETFNVVLSAPTNATIADATGVGTINDDDASFAVSDANVAEGNTGTSNMDFTVTRTGGASLTSTVHYATSDGTATSPADYSTGSGDFTFLPGETSKTVSIPVKGDTLDEPDETLILTLSAPTNGTISDATGTGTIIDDDAASASLAVDDVTVTEGNTGTTNATFTVTKTGTTAQTVTVHYATGDGTAVAPGDYTASSGTLTFAPGDTTKTFSVPVVGDTVDESNEAFTVTLSGQTNATLSDGNGLGTITDDDAGPTLAISDKSINEGDSGTSNASFTVTKTGTTGQTVTVHYATADGTANAPGDYTATTGDLTFLPGDTTKTIDVPVVGDTQAEGDETFSVVLSAPGNATITDDTAAGTIVNDDTQLAINDVTVTEGNTGTVNATFTVTKTGGTASSVTVHYATADGTATQPGDYTSAAGDLTFLPGDSTKTITVVVKGDTAHEANETFNVVLSAATNAAISDATGVGTITDDDSAPTPRIATGAGAGGGPHVALFTPTGTSLGGFFAYEQTFANGIHVAQGDFDGDGRDEIVTAPGPGRAPEIKVFHSDGSLVSSFLAYAPGFSGGVSIAVADVTGDGTPEIITGAGPGGGPHVQVFDSTGHVLANWFAYDQHFTGGVNVAAGDLDNAGKAEIVTGTAGGGAPHIKMWNGDGSSRGPGFYAYDPNFNGGVFVAVGGGHIVTGTAGGGAPHVKVFDGNGVAQGPGFYAYDTHFTGGVRVAVGDADGAPGVEIIMAPGAGGGPHVRYANLDGSGLSTGFYAYNPSFSGGIFPTIGKA